LALYIVGISNNDDIKNKIINKKNWSEINKYAILRWFMFSSIFTLSQIDFNWYYIFLPISITWLIIMRRVYHKPIDKSFEEYRNVTEDQVKIYEREETIDKVLK
jgi:hypothetical protein